MAVKKSVVLLAVVIGFAGDVYCLASIPTLDPGDTAPPFTLQTLLGQMYYNPNSSKSNIQPPLVIHAFTNKSGFLQSLLHNKDSLVDLIANSPENTHYIFMSWEKHAFLVSETIEEKLRDACYRYHTNRGFPDNKPKPTHSPKSVLAKKLRRHRRFLGAAKPFGDGITPTLQTFYEHWRSHLHFVTVTIQNFGNWIPRLLKRWYCNGPGCGLDQIAFVDKDGNFSHVTMRLDARYDWLPSPNTLTPKYKRLPMKTVGDACTLPSVDLTGSLALVTMEGISCSYFIKVRNCQSKGALGVIVINHPHTQLVDMNCHGNECASELHIPATMIPHDAGFPLLNITWLYAQFQNTPSEAFFFSIDSEGKVQESGWFLYPSMIFMAYQAQWMNYKAELKRNLSQEAKVINIFNSQLMQEKGLMANIVLPPIQEMQLYGNMELDLALSCPGVSDRECPIEVSVVQLFVCCEGSGQLCGQEVARWNTAFKRRIGRWLTPVRPLLPLFTSNVCRFTMQTVPACTMPWVATLNIRFTDKAKVKKKYTTFVEYDKTLTPFKIEPLFRGGVFDQEYNKKYLPISFIAPNQTSRVHLVATITGHGKDNNNCAELCVTSHHFVVNGIHNNTRIFKNAGTAMGCADRVGDGVVPNELGRWLYGRGGWCDGQEVTPWVVDITKQIEFESVRNSVQYYGWYNEKDPNPTKEPGNIIMYSYLVYYKYL